MNTAIGSAKFKLPSPPRPSWRSRSTPTATWRRRPIGARVRSGKEGRGARKLRAPDRRATIGTRSSGGRNRCLSIQQQQHNSSSCRWAWTSCGEPPPLDTNTRRKRFPSPPCPSCPLTSSERPTGTAGPVLARHRRQKAPPPPPSRASAAPLTANGGGVRATAAPVIIWTATIRRRMREDDGAEKTAAEDRPSNMLSTIVRPLQRIRMAGPGRARGARRRPRDADFPAKRRTAHRPPATKGPVPRRTCSTKATSLPPLPPPWRRAEGTTPAFSRRGPRPGEGEEEEGGRGDRMPSPEGLAKYVSPETEQVFFYYIS